MLRTIGIAGAGQMGSGIARVCASHGYEVILTDGAAAQLEKAAEAIRAGLERQAAKGTLAPEEVSSVMGRITFSPRLEDLARADFVVEAVTEQERLKLELFAALDNITRPEIILASNTSSISITRLAAVTGRASRVIGMHFMNPPPVMALVEIIRGQATSDETFASTMELAARLGKQTAVAHDYPGFIVNRVLMPMINEAIFALFEGVATVEDIDKGVSLGLNHPMGPLALADLIGLDTVLAIMEVLYNGFRDPRYRPCPLLVKMVDAGQLGKKSGRGFYRYDQGT